MDYYDVLEVARDASQAEIRRAYREKVKQYHPDVSDHPDAAERFRAVARAEEVLGDEDERARYDRLGHEGYRQVVEDGVPEETVERSPAADERATGDERGAASAGDHGGATGGSTRSAGGSRDTGPETGGSWQATGPSAGSDNPSQRSYSPWTSEDDDEADTDEETGFDDWWESQDYEDPPDGTPFESGGSDGSGAAATGRAAAGGTVTSDAPGGNMGGNPGGGSAADGAGGRSTARRKRSSGSAATADGFWTAEVNPDADPATVREPNVVQRTLQSRQATMLTISLLLIYPVFVYFAFTPALPTVLNVVVGLATVTVAVFMLTEPGISLLVFGCWSLLSPLVVVFLQLPLLSPVTLLVLTAFWVPLGLSFVMALAMPSA